MLPVDESIREPVELPSLLPLIAESRRSSLLPILLSILDFVLLSKFEPVDEMIALDDESRLDSFLSNKTFKLVLTFY